MKLKFFLSCFVFLLLFNGCKKQEATKITEKQTSESTKGGVVKQQGQASWYGPGFHGNTTASGETFDQNEMSAASKSLPLGSTAKVTNEETGKSVTVKINDRGPYEGNRVIDLSKAAAKKIGIHDEGVAKVKIVARKPAKKQTTKTASK